ncbi:PEP-CTERM sorting domain-containing protein [Rhizophagus clarus]|uniref:PEP-CTERM sorting domain-containing protein n=1 Tax=Rhizophagus clarus TaxID=94130 RepID=A0A8H3LT73_9GLOM|nr:PEP-CTERM sorting domain-containing protein [Rhizophagus clarus]
MQNALEPNHGEIVAWLTSGDEWYNSWLGVYYNTKPTTVILDNKIFIANGVAMQPANDGRFSVVRFTAPKDGNYNLDVTFTRVHINALYTGVYIIYNNLMTLWEIDLAGPRDSKSFKTTDKGISVKANEPIDFIVGVGLDNIFNADITHARVDIHLLENQAELAEFPLIVGPIGFVLGIIFSAILFICYRYRENRRNANVGYQIIN